MKVLNYLQKEIWKTMLPHIEEFKEKYACEKIPFDCIKKMDLRDILKYN